MLSLLSPAPAASTSSPSASTTCLVSVLPSSVTTGSALNESRGYKSRDDTFCQVADDFPSNLLQSTDPPIDAIGSFSKATMSKTLLSCNTPKVSKGLDCVQCVEVFPDTMNHCVPDWDATGRDMDVIWDPSDLFSPSKGKWDSGHARKSDLGFVPEHDFEELCWEDGQLLVVMQGLNSKGTTKNRSCWQGNVGETPPFTLGINATAIDSTFDTMGTAELADPSILNAHSQEDELLSWLKHPPEDLVEELAIPSDSVSPSTPLVNCEATVPKDVTHQNIQRNPVLLEDLSIKSVSRNVKGDTLVMFPMSTLNKMGQENNGMISKQIQMNISPRCSLIANGNMPSKEPCKSGLRSDRLPPQIQHSAKMGVSCSSPVRNTTSGAMNFYNFSKPAVTFKANLHSLGMANGPCGAERLKLLDRVAVDRVAVDASKSESTDSTTKHLRLLAPRRGALEFPLPTISQRVGASYMPRRAHSFSSQRESEQDATATRAGNGWPGLGVQSDGWSSSIISSTTCGSMRALEVNELSDTSSSGGFEDSDDNGKRGAGVCKRKCAEDDMEIQSKAIENEATDSKKHAVGGESSVKTSRAAENHNQSERRRRDRISEKMKALQALVPNSCKTDKASMLEEAISYIKALKAQIQMMSFRSGMYFSPMLMPQGMQPVQVAAWPHLGMNMGMGMNAGMGVFDRSMAMATAPRQYSPMMPFPGAVIPAVQTATLDSSCLMHGVAGHVLPLAAPQMAVPARQGVPIVNTCYDSPQLNVVPPKIFCASHQQQHVQVGWKGGGNSTSVAQPYQCLQPAAFMTGSGSLQ